MIFVVQTEHDSNSFERRESQRDHLLNYNNAGGVPTKVPTYLFYSDAETGSRSMSRWGVGFSCVLLLPTSLHVKKERGIFEFCGKWNISPVLRPFTFPHTATIAATNKNERTNSPSLWFIYRGNPPQIYTH
jgi:hypothetical protein